MNQLSFRSRGTFLVVALLLLAGSAPGVARAEAVRVEVRQEAGHWQLVRGGTPYFIKGGGGDGSLPALVAAGGNSVRTWGVEKLGERLDEAKRLGVTVTVGIWLGHPDQGFDYTNAAQVEQQAETVRQAILSYRDHPAVLMWGIGNEVEASAPDNAALWSHINSMAALAHRLDPNHPTMAVVAEMGGSKVRRLHHLCPEIDIVGINAYAGGATVLQRYRDEGGTKPFVLTEFGPPGYWESPKQFGHGVELTSTEKTGYYRKAYEKSVLGAEGLCLGSYAFIWGYKLEATPTWFGMFLPDGARLGAVDSMTELWSGKPPASRCPEIASLKVEGVDDVPPGGTTRVALKALSPDHSPLTVKWSLRRDMSEMGEQAEKNAPAFPEAITRADEQGADLKMPADGGVYRLFANVYDNHGGAAVANALLRVQGPVKLPKAAAATLPLIVYDEGDHESPYAPAGWMGNAKAIRLDPKCENHPHAGKTCMRAEFAEASGWGGVVWQSPSGDWGDRAGGLDLSSAKKLTFWARGEHGGEKVTFLLGLIQNDKRFFDTANAKLENVALTPEWKQYSVDLAGKDLSRIKTGFAWTFASHGEPAVFYLDDIQYE